MIPCRSCSLEIHTPKHTKVSLQRFSGILNSCVR